MPVLKQEQKTRIITLPDSGAKLTIFSNVCYGKMVELRKLPNDNDGMLGVVAGLIIDWDFTDDKLTKLPISIDNIKKLSKDDGDFLVEEASKNFSQKKTSISK